MNTKRDAATYLRMLQRGQGALESEGSARDLTKSDVQNSMDRLRERLAGASDQYSMATDDIEKLTRDAEIALSRLTGDGVEAKLEDDQLVGLEAIVVSDGSRPCPVIEANEVVNDNSLGGWESKLNTFSTEIETVIESVGRIDLAGIHQGTGFVVDDHTIITNRHILEAIGSQEPGGDWTINPAATVDFKKEAGNDKKIVFDIGSVVFAGEDEINHGFNLDWLDIAVLRCAPRDDLEFPAKLTLSTDPQDAGTERDVYVVGYPAMPGPGHRYTRAVLNALFDGKFSVKRWSPGQITQTQGSVDGDGHKWAITHDATTLGGNSGSCVVELDEMGQTVIGLHFAGNTNNNYAHVMAELIGYFRERS